MVYRTNRNIVTAFIAILLLLIITIDGVLLSQQYIKLQENAKNRTTQELNLSMDFSYEPMLKNDLVTVQQFLLKWAKNDDILLNLRAITPNGFALVDFKKESNSKNTITISDSIIHENKTLLTVTLTEDISQINDAIAESAFILISTSILVVSLLGYILWLLLRRTAIIPLQQALENHILSEQALEKSSEELKLSNQELESYSYSIAHDLRTPLRSITSFSQILSEEASDKLNSEELNYLDRICKAGNLMSQLIHDILELSKVSREKMEIKTVNLSEIANEIVLHLKNTWPDTDFDVSIQKNLFVLGDESSLRMLMDNLLGNAHKYSSKKQSPKIKFGVQDISEKTPVFYVEDNGDGFDMAFVEQIFIPFHRLHAKNQYEGTGIGLATAKRIVVKHQGEIWVTAEKSKGATFFFTLGNQDLRKSIS